MSTIIRHCGYAALALLAWFAILVAMPFFGPSGRMVAVVGEASSAIRIIAAAGGEVVEVRKGAVLARGGPAALYRAGARLVVEGRIAAGCFQPAGAAAAKAGA